ncbi:MAG: PAS domain S-box protein [Acidobacteriia bacterium]|nr:PAS domain S-box protein [Terriglobia bacterium]
MGVVFLATAGLSVSRQIGVSARARALVIEINADLEQRVAQRTAALGESEGRLASVIQSAMDSIITVDEEQRILLFNAAAERMFRCPAAEALGQPLDRFIPQRFRAAHTGHMKRFGEAGVTTRALGTVDALWGVRADGEEFQIEASISQIEVAGKKLLTVILRDITERRRAEEARERLAAIVDSSDDAIIGKALDGTITAWNRGAEKVFGYPSAEVLGKPMLVLFPPELVNEESDILARISHGESVEHFETVRLRKDGTRIDVSVTISPIWDRSGAVVGASKIARDITERRRAEEERREQAQVLNSAQVFVRDMQSRVVFWPKGAEKLYGFTSQEALGIVSHQLFHTQFPEPLETIEKKLFETGVWEGELIHTKRDGSVITVSSAWALHRDNQGQPARILETNIDVTERNQAEDALRQIDARRKFALETANLGDWELDLTTLQATRSLLHDQIFGYQSLLPEWNFDIFLGHVHPDDRERVRDDFQGCARQGKRWEFECRIVCPNGDIRWIWACGDYYRDSTADATRMFGIVKDITTRKNIENALASQAEELSHQAGELLCSQRALESQKLMLQSVLDSMAEGLAATDEQGKFIIWNPAAEKILGMGAVNLPSQDWTQHYGLYLPDGVTPFPPDQIPLVRAIRGETSLTEMFVRNPEVAEGAWVEVSAGPLKDIGGVVRGGVAAFRDITQKKTAEQEIHRLNEELEHRVVERTAQLEEANQELESFTYSVAHDLRAPLRHIAGFSGILVEEFSPSLDAQAQSYLQRIQDGARKMGELVDELLNLARVGRQTPNLQVAGLNSIVKEVIGILQPEMEGRQVEWKIAALPFVECDPTLVMQVFQNLISNALKYSRPRPLAVIEIGQILESGRPAIFVRDNGVGFSMKYADKLFGVFQRLHRSEDFEGTGVGLATVQRIIKKHQGKVWAEAKLDQGATFYFTLGSLQPDEAKGPTLALGARS